MPIRFRNIATAATVAALVIASAATAQDTTTVRTAPDSAHAAATDSLRAPAVPQAVGIRGLRSPRAALTLGIVFPGAGLMYAGEWWRGVTTYLGAVSGIGGGSMILILADCPRALDFSASSCGRASPSLYVAGAVFVAAGFWIWGRGAVEARRAVERSSARELRGRTPPMMTPILGAPASSGAGRPE